MITNMKKNLVKVCLVLICTAFITVSAMAEARPIWVVAHACNSHKSLQNAIEDGACGVEIDVNTNKNNYKTSWSVNHDLGYQASGLSLEEYLNYPEMDKLSILFLDVKNDDKDFNYPTELVNYVHRILEKRYGKGNRPPYAIIYAYYKQFILDIQVPVKDEDGRTKMITTLEWLKNNLWENEGMNLAWECKESTRFNFSGYIDDIMQQMNNVGFPAYRHFMTHGYFESKWTSANGENVKSTLYAQQLRAEGKYCSRVGFWTCTRYKDAKWFIDPAINERNVLCDLVLVECRNDFILGDSKALKELTSIYFDPNGKDYKKYNKGRFRVANQSDVFYDPKMMGK